MMEVMKTMTTSFKRRHSVPPTRQQATSTPHLWQRLLDTHGQVWVVSCGVTAPFSWVLLHTRFACALQESVSPVLCKFCWLYDGVNGDLLQEAYATLRSAAPRAPAPAAGHCWQVPSQETVKHSSVSVSVGSLSPGVHKVYFSLLSISGRCGVWF